MYLPMAHAEGRLVLRSDDDGCNYAGSGRLCLRYATADGPATSDMLPFPINPNGAEMNVAACAMLGANLWPDAAPGTAHRSHASSLLDAAHRATRARRWPGHLPKRSRLFRVGQAASLPPRAYVQASSLHSVALSATIMETSFHLRN